MWERQISKATGIGGVQAGAAIAGNVIYVAGFGGIDDGFSDAQFGVSLDTGTTLPACYSCPRYNGSAEACTGAVSFIQRVASALSNFFGNRKPACHRCR